MQRDAEAQFVSLHFVLHLCSCIHLFWVYRKDKHGIGFSEGGLRVRVVWRRGLLC